MATAALLFGTAATGTAAATTGLIGTAGAFSLGTAATTAGLGLAATSQIQQGRIAEAQGSFAEKVALRNQQALERQRLAEIEAGKIEEGRISRKERFVRAANIAAGAKSGGLLAGSSLNTLADAAFQFSLDRNIARRNALLRGQELSSRGDIMASQGRFAKSTGKARQRASLIGAGGSVLKGFA